MKPINFWPWYNLMLLPILAISHAAVLYLSIKTKMYKQLIMLSVISGFCVFENIGQGFIVCLAKVDAYKGNLYLCTLEWRFYWICSLIASLIIVLLAINVITQVMHLKYVIFLWSVSIVFGLFVAANLLLPSYNLANMLMISTLADLGAIVALLIIGVIPSARWPKGFPLIVAGIVISVSMDAISALLVSHLHTLKGVYSLSVPMSCLTGCAFYMVAMLLRNSPEKLENNAPLKRNQGA